MGGGRKHEATSCTLGALHNATRPPVSKFVDVSEGFLAEHLHRASVARLSPKAALSKVLLIQFPTSHLLWMPLANAPCGQHTVVSYTDSNSHPTDHD